MSTDDGITPNAARGAKYVTLGQLARTLILFVSTVVLSRLLAPDDFGLMAVSLSVLALGELIRDSGLALAVTRAMPLSRGQKSNLFWINFGLGALTAALVFVLAPVIAAAFGQPALAPIMQWSSLTLLFSGFSTQFRAEINRRMQFARLTIVDTVPAAIGLLAAIVWAVAMPSYWALVAQQLATAVAGALLAVAASRWWPGMPNRASVREFIRFGVGLLGANLLAYLARNGDNYLIGLAWGPTALGYYSRAYQLLMAPMNQLLVPLTRVAVPVLSRSASDPTTFNRRILAAQLGVGAPLSVMYGVLFGLASPVILLVLGPQWDAAVPIFQALCVGGVFRALNQATYWSFVSTSHTGALFRLHLVTQPLILACMAAGLPWGALGVAWGHSIGYALSWFISALWCARVTILSASGIFRQAALVLGFFVAPCMAITAISVELLGHSWLAAGVGTVSLVVWFLLIWLIFPAARRAIRTTSRMVVMATRRGTKGTSADGA